MLNSATTLIQRDNQGGSPMQTMYYIGLDVHKKKISYCVKDGSGHIHAEGAIPAARSDLDRWMKTLPAPWTAAMEATIFTGWIYDHLKPHAAALKVAHPLMLRAIAAANKKNDRIDANKICDCLRCDFLPECYMASTAIRERQFPSHEGISCKVAAFQAARDVTVLSEYEVRPGENESSVYSKGREPGSRPVWK